MLLTTENTKIGFIGLGVMGKSMAENIMQAGYTVTVYTRTKDKAAAVLQQGATWSDTPADAAAQSDIVITMLGYPRDVEEVYFGDKGLLQHVKPGSYLIDMTTSKPELAQDISRIASKQNIHALDAPVSGGDVGALEAKLTIMVGGESIDFEAVQPILKIMGQNIVLQGKAGAGQHTKMCNQIAIASNMMGVCEAMAYAKKAGLDPEVILQSIESGAAGSWSLSNLAPRMLKRDFEPGFYIKHFIKDMGIALETAEEMDLRTPGLSLAKSLYDSLAAAGEENSGTQALFKWYDQL